ARRGALGGVDATAHALSSLDQEGDSRCAGRSYYSRWPRRHCFVASHRLDSSDALGPRACLRCARHLLALGGDYMEVHYEDLVQNPRDTLARIGKFIAHDLDYDRIQQVVPGSVHNPNSSFRGDGKETEANTIGRWKRMFTPPQVRDVEGS